MNTPSNTGTWMHRIMIVLGLIVIVSVIGAIIMTVLNQPMPEMLIVPGIVAAVGLVRLLIPSLLI